MQAQGEHVLIRKPNKIKATEAGLILPDGMDQKLSYGIVLSIGEGVIDLGVAIDAGDYVAYHPQGVEDLAFGSMADTGMVMAHGSHIYLTMTKEDLEERKLPIPE